MHENRETPSPTVSESRSPAGEGESRTTGMHSSGESDGAVVPMKPSNKATGQAPEAAERVEGRASTKENVQQARAVPAQHGAAASQGLKGVRKVAKERKQERFTTLLHHLTVNLLRDSYYVLKREAAPGVDGVRWAEYEDGLEPRLKDLHERVHRGSYRAQASRRIYMQKPDGRQRPIGIAALEDKIVPDCMPVHPGARSAPPVPEGFSIHRHRRRRYPEDDMYITVTGATGFIGRRLIERLAPAKHQLHALSRHTNVKFGDIAIWISKWDPMSEAPPRE